MLLQPGWLDYNHLYVFGKSRHQPEYKILREGFEGGLTKSQISYVFTHQIPPEDIVQYNGARSGTTKADFYDDCSAIPDPSDLDPTQKNLLLLDDFFLGKQNKAEAIIAIPCTLRKAISDYLVIPYGKIQILSFCFDKTIRI